MVRLPNINYCIISGRLTRDPEIKHTQSGIAVAKLTVANDRNYKKNDEWIKDTSFLDVIVWGKNAERCGEELKKGSPVIVEGYNNTRTYKDKDDNTRKVTEIVANRVSNLEPKPIQDNQTSQQDETDDVPF